MNGSYVRMLTPGVHRIVPPATGRYFSLFSLDSASVICVRHARYQCCSLIVGVGSNRASRNRFLDNQTTVEVVVKSGRVTLVIPPPYLVD